MPGVGLLTGRIIVVGRGDKHIGVRNVNDLSRSPCDRSKTEIPGNVKEGGVP